MAGVPDIDALLAGVRSDVPATRRAAWKSAGEYGAAAIEPLVRACDDTVPVSRRAAGFALAVAVHHAAAGGTGARRAAADALIAAAAGASGSTAATVIHLAGFVADSSTVHSLGALMPATSLADEARMALERTPGAAAAHALEQVASSAAEPFRSAARQSVRARRLRRGTVGTERPGA